jgi:hypothetical protein
MPEVVVQLSGTARAVGKAGAEVPSQLTATPPVVLLRGVAFGVATVK